MKQIEMKRIAKKVLSSKVYIKDMVVIESNEDYFAIKVNGSKYIIFDYNGWNVILGNSKKPLKQLYEDEKKFLISLSNACK